MSNAASPGALSLLFLERSRSLLRTRVGAMMVAFVALLYAFVSLLVGQMLVLRPTAFTSVQTEVVTGSGANAWWNYPALVVTGPGAVLVLPFLATVTMVVVSIGVGIGMSVGLVLAYRLLRRHGADHARPATLGSVSGLTPAVIALVTLGACCSTTAAATAGIGVVAQSSGTSIASVLANTWYLNVFQVAVLWVALVAQEQLLSVYGRLLGGETSAAPAPASVPVDARFLLGAVLRVGLVVAGVTWSLAMVAEWTSAAPPAVTVPTVVQWLLQHLFVGLFAIAAGLFAVGTYRFVRESLPRARRLAVRGALLVGGLSLLTWVPAPLAGWGVFGLGNEILGAAGFPAAWGAVALPSIGPLPLALRWLFQFGLLGAFATVAALWPERAFLPLQWTTEPRIPTASPADRNSPSGMSGGDVAARAGLAPVESGGSPNA
ncbi:MAG: hypothetical protein L3K00_04000 [Thermoplasmata archaeon]|nr:hypothetical protein [Thermoplasmata archaeon]MCI4362420.1 hypothetical protein [Thermoplasmata archaeon]